MNLMTLPNGHIILRAAQPLPMPVVSRSAFVPRHKPRRRKKAKAARLYYSAIGPMPSVTLDEAIDALIQVELPVARAIASIERPICASEFSVSQIVEAVVNASGVPLNDVMSVRRSPVSVRAKHIAMWLCVRLTKLSSPQIGSKFGRDHTTILHGVARINAILAADTGEAAEIRMIIAQCRRELGLTDDGVVQ